MHLNLPFENLKDYMGNLIILPKDENYVMSLVEFLLLSL